MHDSSTSTDPFLGLSADEIELLRWRATRYAQKPSTDQSDQTEVIVFVRGGTRYAAALDGLREIRPLRTFCPIPGGTSLVPGVFHYRGEILSVYDLSCLLNPDASHPYSDWVVVVEHDGARIGLVVDEVIGVEPTSAGKVRPVPISLGEHTPCFQGVLDGGALLLHTARLISL